MPIGAAVIRADGRATLHGFISDVKGERIVRGELAIDESAPTRTGMALAALLRERGAGEVLGGLHRPLIIPAPQPE